MGVKLSFPHPDDEHAFQSDVARNIASLSVQRWGHSKPVVLVGRDERLLHAQRQLVQFAEADGAVLITGETGVGKELFARALHLLSARLGQPFLSVNCAQYRDSHLLTSELFGHVKGSFTGAVTDRRGVFEEAHRGVVFLDEIAELSLAAQAMLLRTLGEGEVVRVGESRPRYVDVRVVAATGRGLGAMIATGTFRRDLFYRLRLFQVEVPPVRARGQDWQLLVQYFLGRLQATTAGARPSDRTLSTEAWRLLAAHDWPGNVREIKSVVETGFHLSRGSLIEPPNFASALETVSPEAAIALPADEPCGRTGGAAEPAMADDTRARLAAGESFWKVVYQPFMDRELNRREARDLIAQGLAESGSYKRLLSRFGIPPEQYLKFMDFLRHHRLKPR